VSRPILKWYGFAGHHICGARCQFHLSTSINGKFLVSTVGLFVPDPLRAPNKMEPVMSGWHFETVVFEMDGDDENGDPKITNWDAIETEGYNDSLQAERNHQVICEKYSEAAA